MLQSVLQCKTQLIIEENQSNYFFKFSLDFANYKIFQIRKRMFTTPIYSYHPSQSYMNYYYPQMLMPYYQPTPNYAYFMTEPQYNIERTSNGKVQNEIQVQPKTDKVVPKKKSPSQLERARAKALAKKAMKELTTSKKNGESNIVNRFFTLFQNEQRSKAMVIRIISSIKQKKQSSENIINDFYKIIIQLSNSQKRSYVSRKNLFDLAKPQTLRKKIEGMKYIGFQIHQSYEILSELFRKCIQKFLNSWGLLSIVNSKRISSIGKKEYLRRKRQIEESFRTCLNSNSNISEKQ